MKTTKTVYCYYFPEVRKIIDGVVRKYPHEIFLQSIEPGLDDFHIPIIEKYVNFFREEAVGLSNFQYKYFTDGSRQGIFSFLVETTHKEPNTPLYTLKGEYEGYKEYAIRIGNKVTEVDEKDISKIPSGIFLISNPSARDGNIIQNEFINNICKYHRVVYDLAYLGLTKKYAFDLTNENIIAIFCSMSKSFGIYYYRAGFAFTREPLETLIANKWFKNIFSLLVTKAILENIKSRELYNKYRPIQSKIIKELNKQNSLRLKESDAILLAHTYNGNTSIEEYRRGDCYRLCLTPYFLDFEKKESLINEKELKRK